MVVNNHKQMRCYQLTFNKELKTMSIYMIISKEPTIKNIPKIIDKV